MSRACSHPCTRLNTLPLKMMRPTMNGKVPESTPAADQPMPLLCLQTTTAAATAPGRSSVAVSSLRRETIICIQGFSVQSNHNHVSNSLMFRDARRCRAPHHEDLDDLILRSIANGSRECAPDDRLRDASRRM